MCTHGETMFILEERYGNDGYAFWFKLLEILGNSEGHYFRVGNTARMAFLVAKMRVDDKTATEILDLLALLKAIDPELWAVKVVWSQNFVDNLTPLYAKREGGPPRKPDVSSISDPEIPDNVHFRDGNNGSGALSASEIHIVKERRGEDSIGEERKRPATGKLAIDAFQKRDPIWPDQAGNLAAIPELVKRSEQRGDPEKVLPAMIQLFFNLIDGQRPDMTQKDKAFWGKQPPLPKRMLSLWETLEGEAQHVIRTENTTEKSKSHIKEIMNGKP